MSSTSLLARELIGSQTPRVWSVPSAPTSAGGETVRLASLAGLELLPWQAFVLEHAMRQRADERWAAFEVVLLVARQNGKGSVLEAAELYMLFVLGLNVFHTAHLMKTSRKAFKRLMVLIDRTPQLKRRVADVRRTAEELTVTLTNGAFATFMVRGQRAGRGLDDCDILVLDEALFLDPKTTEAIVPTMSTRPNPQIWYTSSAGVASSTLLRGLRDRGRAGGDDGLAFFEWSIEPPADDEPLDPLDVDGLAMANPSLGTLITLDYVRGEQKALTPQGFARERQGVFDEDPAKAKPVISATAWAARGGLEDERPTGPVAFAVAASPDGLDDWTAIGVAGRNDAGEVLLQVVEYRPGSGWVPERITELSEAHGPVAVVVDPAGPAGFLIDDIEDLGVDVTRPKLRDVAHATAQFVAGVSGDAPTARHYDQEHVRVAVGAAGKKTVGDAYVLQRRGEIDISPLECVLLAEWGVATHGRVSSYEDRGLLTF